MGSYGPPPDKFLHFHKLERKPNQKTDRWDIMDHTNTVQLGIIRFYPQWRCYVAEPKENTVWSWDCAEELAGFLRRRTFSWRDNVRARKNK